MRRKYLYVCGFPKSGNTWLSRLLGDVLDSPIGGHDGKKALADEGAGRPGDYLIKQRHVGQYPTDAHKVVFIIRDPRDVCVSVQHYWQIREIVRTIRCVGKGLWPIEHGGGWSNFNKRWLSICVPDANVTYEELHSDTEGHLERVLESMRISPTHDISTVVERQSFEVRRKQLAEEGENHPYGPGIQLRNLRAGTVGDWRDIFDRECARLAEKYFGDLMRELGYEEREDWWRDLEG